MPRKHGSRAASESAGDAITIGRASSRRSSKASRSSAGRRRPRPASTCGSVASSHEQFLQGVQGAQAFPGRVQAEPGADRGAGRSARHLLGARQAQHGAEAARAAAQERQDGAGASALCSRARRRALRSRRLRRATETYAKALQASERRAGDIARAARGRAARRRRLAGAHRRLLLRAGHDAPDASGRRPRSSCARRASRGASRPSEVEGMLAQAYAADPTEHSRGRALREACSSRRSAPTRSSRRSAQRARSARRTPNARATLRSASARAGRCATRTRSSARSSSRRRCELDPVARSRRSRICATPTARKDGDWERVIALADELADRSDRNGDARRSCSRKAGLARLAPARRPDPRARASSSGSRALAPEHPALRAFEAQIGETLERARRRRASGALRAAAAPPAAGVASRRPSPAVAPAVRAPSRPPSRRPAPAPAARAAPPAAAPRRRRRRRRRSPSFAKSSRSRKRPSATTSTSRRCVALGDAVADPEREGRLLPAGRRPLRQQVLEPGRGGEGLREGPRARPEQPGAVDVPARRCTRSAATGRSSSSSRVREAERLPRGPRRARSKFKQIAQLATETRQEARGLHRALGGRARERRRGRRGAERAVAAVRARARLREARRRAARSRPRSPTTPRRRSSS